jgi:hypothetical protein
MKIEQKECSETLEFELKTPGNNAEESIRQFIVDQVCIVIDSENIIILTHAVNSARAAR